MASPNDIAAAIGRLLGADRSIATRAAQGKTTLLVADTRAISAAINVIGSTDVPLLIQAGAKAGTQAPNVPAPIVTDTLGPTMATGLTAAVGVGSLVWSFDQVADLQDGATDPSGLPVSNAYELELSGSSIFLPRLSANALAQPTLAAVGSPTASAVTVTGRKRLLTVSGLGWDGDDPSGDQFVSELIGTYTGPFTITAKINSFDALVGTPSEYAAAGIRLEDNGDGNRRTARFISFTRFFSASQAGAQVKRRLVAAAGYANYGSVQGNGGQCYVQVERLPSNLFVYRLSFDGGAWTEFGRETRDEFSNVMRAYVAGHTLHATATGRVEFEDVRVISGPRLAYTQSTTSATPARVRSIDAAGNYGPWSPIVTRTPAAAGGTSMRLPRGFGRRFIPTQDSAGIGGRRFDLPQHRDALVNRMALDHDEPGIKYYQVEGFWHAFEGNIKGDYSAGFAAMDVLVAAAKTHGKKLCIFITYGHSGDIASNNHVYPAYVLSTYGVCLRGDYGRQGGGGYAPVWKTECGDDFRAMVKAYGDRYKGEATIAFVGMCESSTNLPENAGQELPNGVGFNGERMVAFFRATHEVSSAAWPQTLTRFGANDMPSIAQMAQAIADCVELKCAVGGPDVVRQDADWAFRIYRGIDPSTTPAVDNNAYPDRVNGSTPVIPWIAEVQTQSIPRWTAAQLHDAVCNGWNPENGDIFQPAVKPYMMIFEDNQYWDSHVLPFIRSNYLTTPMLSYPAPSCFASVIEG